MNSWAIVFFDVEGRPVGRVPILEQPTLVGRAVDGPGRIDDPRVSRTHMQVRLYGAGIGALVRNLSKTNGLRVNGVACEESVVTTGAILDLGGARGVIVRD